MRMRFTRLKEFSSASLRLFKKKNARERNEDYKHFN